MERIVCLKIDNWEKEYLEKASKITMTEYIDTNYIEVNYLITLIQDLVTEYGNLQEAYELLEERYTDKYFGKE